MIRKFSIILSLSAIFILTGTSCSEELSDCPTKVCVMAGGWQLVEVQVDGDAFDGDYSQYSLTLINPSSPDETSSLFQRVNISGNQDSGTWSIENTNPSDPSTFKGSVLRLAPEGNIELREDWEIESFSPRQMVLIMHRDTNIKDGPAEIRYVLEPF
jgi:hypothetical protein